MLVSHKNKTAVMLVSQTSPMGVDLVPTSFPGLFPLNLGGAGKDPGIGWSRDSKHPKILGVINYDVMNV